MEGVHYKEIGVLLKLLPDPESAQDNLTVVQVQEEYSGNHPCRYYSTRWSDIEGEGETCFCYPMMTDEIDGDENTLVRPHKTAPYHLGKNIPKEHLRYVEI